MLFFLIFLMRNVPDTKPVITLIKGEIKKERPVFNMDKLVEYVFLFPDEILPPYRKKRTYFNSIMALNEMSKESPYCKEAFMRVDYGKYVLNPEIEF